jgi:hypothetical protein
VLPSRGNDQDHRAEGILCPDRVATLLERIRQRFPATIVSKAEWRPGEIYEGFTDQDLALATSWVYKTENKEYEKARMLSARWAEKAAARFYRTLGYETLDVSIEQLLGRNSNWKTYDLLIDGSIPIDVKNARTPVNNRQRYVDLSVPAFKSTRARKEVRIVGVLSPYLRLPYLLEPNTIQFDVSSIRYLGETALSEIDELKRSFSSDMLEKLTIDRKLIPPWMFDFPSLACADTGSDPELIRLLQDVSPESFDALPFLTDKNLISIFLMAGIELPEMWRDTLRPWQQTLYADIQRNCANSISLPRLFLTILTHFLHMLRSDSTPKSYSPTGYRELLFWDNTELKWPVGLPDPLGMTADLYSTLVTLWKNRHKTNLKEFVRFQFQ